MKGRCLRLKKSWRGIFLLVSIGVVVGGVFWTCRQTIIDVTPNKMEYPIPENTEIIVSNVIQKGNEFTTVNGNLVVGLTASARFFYLPKNSKHYQQYYDLITAKREPNILQFTIGKSTADEVGSPIIKVEVPDNETLQNYLHAIFPYLP